MDQPQPGPTENPAPRSKKLRWLLLFLVLGVGCAVFATYWSNFTLRREVELIRQRLLQEGFKLDFVQFDFSTTPELATRASSLTAAATACRQLFPVIPTHALLPAVGSNAAIIVWQQAEWKIDPSIKDQWVELGRQLPVLGQVLDSASTAAVSGPLRFALAPRMGGSGIPLPHLSDLGVLRRALASRILFDLHQTNDAAIWPPLTEVRAGIGNSLLALTRLATAWNLEAMEVSHFARFNLAETAQKITWQVLQAGTLSENQLTALQHEWESVDYFSALPETAALYRAGLLDVCRAERQSNSVYSVTRFLEELVDSPRVAWSNAQVSLRQAAYRRSGSYEDEKEVMLYFRERELELREVIKANVWVTMSQLPGAGKAPTYKGVPGSRIEVFQNQKRVTAGYRLSLVQAAAMAEARRRVVIAALAIERFRLKSGHYPESLQQLVPEFLARPPIDFIDGHPLRYFRTEEPQAPGKGTRPTGSHFVLYSIGLDGVDEHGVFLQPDSSNTSGPLKGDLVWPRPATPAEIEKFQISNPIEE